MDGEAACQAWYGGRRVSNYSGVHIDHLLIVIRAILCETADPWTRDVRWTRVPRVLLGFGDQQTRRGKAVFMTCGRHLCLRSEGAVLWGKWSLAVELNPPVSFDKCSVVELRSGRNIQGIPPPWGSSRRITFVRKRILRGRSGGFWSSNSWSE